MSTSSHPDETTAKLRSTIGPRLRSARKALGLTQEDAAEMIGISCEFYARMERSNALPSVSTLKRMALALRVTVDYLFGVESSQRASNSLLPARVRDPKQLKAVIDKARDDPELTRFLIALLKYRDGQSSKE